MKKKSKRDPELDLKMVIPDPDPPDLLSEESLPSKQIIKLLKYHKHRIPSDKRSRRKDSTPSEQTLE
jgi:hypothetical protein